MNDKFKKCVTCSYFECVDLDGFFLEKGFCLIQKLGTFVDDDHLCDEYVLDKEVAKDIERGLWE